MTGVRRTRCCIVGCGPAGAMLALMLARRGVEVLVLEKHGDFLRDFRGDDLAPSTLEIIDELGLGSAFLELEPKLVSTVELRTPTGSLTIADFRGLGGRFPYAAVIPQWDFLDFVTRQAARHPCYQLEMNAEAVDLVQQDGRVVGVRYRAGGEVHEVRAALTVAADGRRSVIRERAGLTLLTSEPPIDLLWFRLPKGGEEHDRGGISIAMGGGRAIGLINRGTYWQVSYVIPKGSFDDVRKLGIDALRRSIARLLPELSERTATLRDWAQVSLLSVQANRLCRWYRPGLLCIGDAAHAMSPIGGAGINVGVQDAVVAANLLAEPLLRGQVTARHLRRVQRRRAWQIRLMQVVQSQLTGVVLGGSGEPGHEVGRAHGLISWLLSIRWLTTVRSRFIGLGIRRPHVTGAAVAPPAPVTHD